MKIHQLSVFLENKPGRLAAPCEVLAEAGINLVTLSLGDTRQFGILRLIVRDWQRAKDVLEAAGVAVKVTEVLAIEVDDRPGGLAAILRTIEQAGLNVEYMYAFTEKVGDRAALVFRVDKPDAAACALTKAGISVLGDVELYKRLEGA
jgi:hypothetical protein